MEKNIPLILDETQESPLLKENIKMIPTSIKVSEKKRDKKKSSIQVKEQFETQNDSSFEIEPDFEAKVQEEEIKR